MSMNSGPGGRPRRRPTDGGGGGRKFTPRRKVCRFCANKIGVVDYKDVPRLSDCLSDRGKIEPRRKTGTCALHQRSLNVALKRARHLALLPFTAEHIRTSGMIFRQGPMGPRGRRPFEPTEQAEPTAPPAASSQEASDGSAPPVTDHEASTEPTEAPIAAEATEVPAPAEATEVPAPAEATEVTAASTDATSEAEQPAAAATDLETAPSPPQA